jgi:hypothetical protein
MRWIVPASKQRFIASVPVEVVLLGMSHALEGKLSLFYIHVFAGHLGRLFDDL